MDTATLEDLWTDALCMCIATLDAVIDTTRKGSEFPAVLKRASTGYALVQYALPFLDCKDNDNKNRRASLNKYVPREHRQLHEDIMSLRNHFLAHRDFPASACDSHANQAPGHKGEFQPIRNIVIRTVDLEWSLDELCELFSLAKAVYYNLLRKS